MRWHLTYSEWEQASLDLQVGYVWGVIEAVIFVGDSEEDHAGGVCELLHRQQDPIKRRYRDGKALRFEAC